MYHKKIYEHVAILREFERGWGAQDFEAREFASKQEAEAWVREQNKKNTAPVAPDYYIQARYHGDMDEDSFRQINDS